MRETIIICNCCGKRITNEPPDGLQLLMTILVDKKNVADYCNKCGLVIAEVINKKIREMREDTVS
jgi:hypothetical protein